MTDNQTLEIGITNGICTNVHIYNARNLKCMHKSKEFALNLLKINTSLHKSQHAKLRLDDIMNLTFQILTVFFQVVFFVQF